MSRASNQAPAPASNRWPRFREDLGVLLWASFLAACVTTVLFFAFFDPVQLAAGRPSPGWLEDRMTAYGLGFFFFWAMCTIASFLTAYLIDTRTSDRSGS